MHQKPNKVTTLSAIGALFAISGFAALIYQITWQRLLFALFGVDTESVTIIVTTFMLGLGCGGLIGGRISDRYRQRCIHVFLICEIMIGFFGLFSQKIIGAISPSGSLSDLAIKTVFLLLIPTTLMGMTLPLLSIALIERGLVVSESVGKLYYFNTVGAAMACLSTGFFIFNVINISQTIYLAASLNFLVAISGFILREKFK